MDEAQFSMEAPEDYKVESQELDLLGSTEEDFIEGLRIQAEFLNDGVFPDDVSIEYVVKTSAQLKDKFNKLKMTDDEKNRSRYEVFKRIDVYQVLQRRR